MTQTLTLPVIPLREAVLFPGVTSPIAVGRPGTVSAVDAALNSPDKLVFVVSQRENVEEATPEVLYGIGTIASIGPVQRGLSGMRLLLNGQRRAAVLRFTPEDGHLVATVREAEEVEPLDVQAPAFVALFRELQERAAELGTKAGLPKEVVSQFLAETTDPGRFADIVAGHLDIKAREGQEFLEALAVEDRLRMALIHVQRQLSVLQAQEDIKSQVQEELGDRQREMILRQQLKAIQRELGDDDKRQDLDELREKLEALDLSQDVRKEVDREFGRLERIGPEGMESQVIRTFLETVAELPWSERSDDRIDIDRANVILDEDHYGLADVKDRVLEFLAVRLMRDRLQAEREGVETSEVEGEVPEVKGNEDDHIGRAPILLFAGPPGVGKTSIAKSIARSMGREYVRVSLGGVRDEADIRGHRRTYVGAMPGRVIQGMKQAGTKNPVFLLDEVDKLGVSYQGDPSSALLEVLDPAQNDSFTDHYLGVPFDLSEVLFIATANFLQNIPGPLLDRMEVVEFAGYTEREKLEIAKRYLVPRQMRESGLTTGQIELADEALSELISGYTREAGVRQLEREIGRLARKVARLIATDKAQRVEVDRGRVRELLGRPRVHPEVAADADQVGVATGMYYTPVGGDIMFVETSTMPGKGDFTLTGQLGDVMKESARAAWTYARAHADELYIDGEGFKQDVHIHVPAGAIPKDGPSAGVTMATALVSALSGRPVRNDVAMTGEITLTGRILPIGGVKEKVLGAVRAGICEIVLPKQNEADLDDLPEEVRNTIRVHLVEELGEVLAHTMRGGSFREGRLFFEPEEAADSLHH